MQELTRLEKAVLTSIAKIEREMVPMLNGLLPSLRSMGRKNTGHGFYTELHTPRRSAGSWPNMVYGPYAQMLDMGPEALMGFILWCTDRGPKTLEGFQLGDANGQTVDLRERDLAQLGFGKVAY